MISQRGMAKPLPLGYDGQPLWGFSFCENQSPLADLEPAESPLMSVAMPLIAVDVGNSRYKFGLFPIGWHNEIETVPQPADVLDLPIDPGSLNALTDWLGVPPASFRWRIASVSAPAARRLTEWLSSTATNMEARLLSLADTPLVIQTDRPEAVGVDRLMAAVAASRLGEPGRAAIVIDAGSAVTVDLISASGEFLGGAILSGMAMSARALHQTTDQLPQIDVTRLSAECDGLGRSTQQAMGGGLYWGSVGAIRELVSRLSALVESEPSIFLTGGAAPALSVGLGPTFHLTPHLVLRGIAASAM